MLNFRASFCFELVVGAFIVNFDIVGNAHCWHRYNNKEDNYYKHIYPMNDKQYNAVLEKYSSRENLTEEVIYGIVNDILYKDELIIRMITFLNLKKVAKVTFFCQLK